MGSGTTKKWIGKAIQRYNEKNQSNISFTPDALIDEDRLVRNNEDSLARDLNYIAEMGRDRNPFDRIEIPKKTMREKVPDLTDADREVSNFLFEKVPAEPNRTFHLMTAQKIIKEIERRKSLKRK